jgi:hypothetical protein
VITVCIGFDPAETVAYHVLCHSIMRHSSVPVRFIPINKRNIPEFQRGKEDGSTEFSFSRFLTPYLCGYQGQAIFMDCDMLVRSDISEILNCCDFQHDVFVVKHDYIPKEGKKFLGNTQHVYPKKNWSSVMVFNCFMPACKRLTPDVVSNESGKYLHQFEWSEESRVGSIPKEWNHLVGEYDPSDSAKIAHFTLGTPCFIGYEDQEFADEWQKEKDMMNYART